MNTSIRLTESQLKRTIRKIIRETSEEIYDTMTELYLQVNIGAVDPTLRDLDRDQDVTSAFKNNISSPQLAAVVLPGKYPAIIFTFYDENEALVWWNNSKESGLFSGVPGPEKSFRDALDGAKRLRKAQHRMGKY